MSLILGGDETEKVSMVVVWADFHGESFGLEEMYDSSSFSRGVGEGDGVNLLIRYPSPFLNCCSQSRKPRKIC